MSGALDENVAARALGHLAPLIQKHQVEDGRVRRQTAQRVIVDAAFAGLVPTQRVAGVDESCRQPGVPDSPGFVRQRETLRREVTVLRQHDPHPPDSVRRLRVKAAAKGVFIECETKPIRRPAQPGQMPGKEGVLPIFAAQGFDQL